jgi:tetratricopeptide (TPR) repeat protein
VVHRDIKPSNIFLRDGSIDHATLIDFGIARRRRGDRVLVTQTGVLLGTPEYMAPEQARGQTDVGPAADVFSLGCVLFECLTGRPPFVGDHVTAVLAKILFDDPPKLLQFRPDLTPQLEALVGRMLAREPGERIADGAAVVQALRALPTLTDLPAPPRAAAPLDGGGEQHFFSLVLAGEPTTLGEQATLQANLPPPSDELTQSLRRLGADVEALLDGTLAAAFPPAAGLAPGDRATLAVRCALLVKERRPGHLVSVATGRGIVSDGLPRGEGIDRAAALLRADAPPELVRADRLTAELVGRRFELRPLGPDSFAVLGEHTSLDESRPLLGKPTPCVGREQELGVLEGALAACVDEQSARVVVVRAGPGMGKSRLRHELLRRAVARVEGLDVIVGRADLMRAGAAYGLIGAALRQRWSLGPCDEPAEQRRKLREALARELPAAAAERACEFLGEMCGVPCDEPSAPMLAARRDPKLMLAQQTDAFIDLLRAACERAPVLLVLEDLHWGDAPSFALVDAALRVLADRPLLVVGLARPDIDEHFPNLWKARGVQDLKLAPLSRRAAERLIHHALGRDFDAEQVARLLDRSGGHPLFLEELIRAAAAGKHDGAPETVLAMLHHKLLRFDPGLRRALRAAATFGEVFWRGGLQALLGRDGPVDVGPLLHALVEHELVVPQAGSRLAGEVEYAFRHALLREAAYSLSSAEDLARDHLLAARFLERSGERDPRVLAEHCLRAGARDEAAAWILAAAIDSYRACDSAGVLALVDRGVACEPRGEVLAGLHAMASWVHAWNFNATQSEAHRERAVEHAVPGSPWWCSASTGQINHAVYNGDLDRFHALVDLYLATDPLPEAEPVYVQGVATFISLYALLGLRAPAVAALRRLHAIGDRHPRDSGAQAWMAIARSDFHRSLAPDPAGQLAEAEAAARRFAESGDRRNGFFAEVLRGQAEGETGLLAEGEATLRGCLAEAEAMQDPFYIAMASLHLAAALGTRLDPGARAEALALAERILRLPAVSRGYRGWAHAIIAHVLLDRGEIERASEHAEQAAQVPATNVLRLRIAAALRMRIALGRGALAEARALATVELAVLGTIAAGYVEVPVRLTIADVLYACGERQAALSLLGDVLRTITARARTIADPVRRARYLRDVPAHAEAHARARAWNLDVSAA